MKKIYKNDFINKNKNFEDNDDTDEDSENKDGQIFETNFFDLTKETKIFLEEKISIPLLIVIGIVVSYVFVGLYLFGKLEEWSLIESFYFLFISMTTIGYYFYYFYCYYD